MAPELSLVVPIFGEEAVLPALLARTRAALDGLGRTYEIVFVDDGSTDRSLALLREAAASSPAVRIVKLSRNFGLQAAVSAGLAHARGQVVGLMDGDLQDPPELLGAMLAKLEEGHDVVYMLKRSRRDTAGRRFFFALFHRLFRLLSRTPMPLNAGLFSLMRRRVVRTILDCPERRKFVPGLRAWVGYAQAPLEFDRDARGAGVPRQTFGRLLGMALDAVYSFTDIPLKLAMVLGIGAAFLSLVAIAVLLGIKLFTDLAITGWTSTLVAIFFMGGVQLVCVGLLGEYISRLYDEVRRRPQYVVDEVIEARAERAEGVREG